MSPLTDIQDNIEKLRSLQESLHDLCTFISTLDLTSGAKEDTLTHGVNVINQKIDDINIPELDKSDLAKEATLSNGIDTLSNKIDNIDLSSVENKVDEVKQAVENIKFPEIDTTELAKKTTLNTVSSKLDNLNVEADLTQVAKQGSNADATNSAIYSTLNEIKDDVIDIMKLELEEVDNLLDL